MNDHLQQRIRECCYILEKSGYYPYQINEICRDCIGRSNLESLSEQEATAIVACLEEYVSFAQKCKQNKK